MSASPPEKSESLPLIIRPMCPGDVPLVLNSWLKSYRDCPATWGVGNDDYFRVQKAVISKLLGRCNVAIACDTADPDQIFGWLAWEETPGEVVVHYIYVKHLFQRMGVAKQLWQHLDVRGHEIIATHTGPSSPALSRQPGVPQFRYKPFRLISCLLSDGPSEVPEAPQGQLGCTVTRTHSE
jgi:GNAT superfamily N-acetyltransferase